MEVTIIRKVELSMDEQKKYEVIKSLADRVTSVDTVVYNYLLRDG